MSASQDPPAADGSERGWRTAGKTADATASGSLAEILKKLGKDGNKRPKELYSFGIGKRSISEDELAEVMAEEHDQGSDHGGDGMMDKKADNMAYSFGMGKRDPYAFGLGKRPSHDAPYAFGLGKRDPYAFGLGKRADPYQFGLGKRDPYQFGLGKRDPYAFGLGKRDPYAFGLGRKRDPYAFGLGKRDPYAFGLGRKRDPYAFGLGKR